jgi:hypothetical protein
VAIWRVDRRGYCFLLDSYERSHEQYIYVRQEKNSPATPMLHNTGQQNLLHIIGDIRAKSPQNAAIVPIRASIYLRDGFTRA